MKFFFPAFLRTKFLDPFEEFLEDSKSIGIVLLTFTFISLLLANLFPSYHFFWQKKFHFLSGTHFPGSLADWINDGLMTVFFFTVTLEIRYEIISGEMASFSKSLLPVGAAAGGMIVPAVIYCLFNLHTPYKNGWGIPMATDIAFSIGVLSLLGKRVPLSLKIFLTALAIIDDLGAIIVIAIFYGGKINLLFLLGSIVLAVFIFLLYSRVKKMNVIFFITAIIVWYCMYNSGIHATIAGVLLAFCVPQKSLHKFQSRVHNTVYFFILPLFVMANTAILLPSVNFRLLGGSLSLGIIAGLFIGKPLGIISSVYLLKKIKLATFPSGCSSRQMAGAGLLAGIGFTMSIFIANLAFTNEVRDAAKVSVLIASFLAMFTGFFWLRSAKNIS